MEKQIEYIKDETGLITNIKINGKAVKAGSMRGFKKAQKTPFFFLYTQPMVAENRFSGERVPLNALEATIYSWCEKWYNRYSAGNMPTPIQTYDDMKYLLLEINSKAYMSLID